jgi:hypothetical protein
MTRRGPDKYMDRGGLLVERLGDIATTSYDIGYDMGRARMSYDVATTSLHVVYDMEGHPWRLICNVVRCRTTWFHVVYDMDRHPWELLCDVVRCRYDIVPCRIRHGQTPLEAHVQCRTMSYDVVTMSPSRSTSLSRHYTSLMARLMGNDS